MSTLLQWTLHKHIETKTRRAMWYIVGDPVEEIYRGWRVSPTPEGTSVEGILAASYDFWDEEEEDEDAPSDHSDIMVGCVSEDDVDVDTGAQDIMFGCESEEILTRLMATRLRKKLTDVQGRKRTTGARMVICGSCAPVHQGARTLARMTLTPMRAAQDIMWGARGCGDGNSFEEESD